METNLSLCSVSEIVSNINKLEERLIIIISDSRVSEFYLDDIQSQINSTKRVIVYKAPEGELSKTFIEYERCLELLISKKVHRKAHVIALGGGALSDFAGFVAATLLRGLSWSIIPTSLLSMVDASIGGKVAINSKEMKNLIGSFHLPRNVWINPDFLESLPASELDSGKGEIIKYCFLNNDIYSLVFNDAPMERIVKACAEYKKALTEEDFKEGHKRKVLNLGHTFGHALERIYQLPHGVSVVWGMLLIFEVYQKGEHKDELKSLCEKMQINLGEGSPWLNKTFPIEQIMNYISKDKKVQSDDEIDVVLVSEIGTPDIQRKKISDLENILKERKDELKKLTL